MICIDGTAVGEISELLERIQHLFQWDRLQDRIIWGLCGRMPHRIVTGLPRLIQGRQGTTLNCAMN